MMCARPLIEVVIPHWNGREMLMHCLESLRSQSYQDFNVTVVDNGSEDDSLLYLKREYPFVKLIAFKENTGFSVAVNSGISSSSASWILLLNNDMEVEPTCLENLVFAVRRYEKVDFFALKMMNYHQRQRLDGAGDAVLRGGVGYRIGTMEEDQEIFKHDRAVFGACGGAALYSREFFCQVGLFDPDFFAYLEDVDLNFRARRLGLQCMYIASAVVYHIGSASTGSKINRVTIKLSTRNNIYIIAKNYSWSLLLRFLLPLLIYQVMWSCFCLKKGMFLPYLQGVWEALLRLPRFLRRRRMSNNQAISIKKIADIICQSEKEAIDSIMRRRLEQGKSNLLLNWYRLLFL